MVRGFAHATIASSLGSLDAGGERSSVRDTSGSGAGLQHATAVQPPEAT